MRHNTGLLRWLYGIMLPNGDNYFLGVAELLVFAGVNTAEHDEGRTFAYIAGLSQ
ncbi:hypothetical protein [uncultured Halopseudomonas sp.]|uniref:hypothetical protein n=1 Tax=uncultured Halopseudomonas sp. TaxID=2901193 RepID=UPI0030EE8311